MPLIRQVFAEEPRDRLGLLRVESPVCGRQRCLQTPASHTEQSSPTDLNGLPPFASELRNRFEDFILLLPRQLLSV